MRSSTTSLSTTSTRGLDRLIRVPDHHSGVIPEHWRTSHNVSSEAPTWTLHCSTHQSSRRKAELMRRRHRTAEGVLHLARGAYASARALPSRSEGFKTKKLRRRSSLREAADTRLTMVRGSWITITAAQRSTRHGRSRGRLHHRDGRRSRHRSCMVGEPARPSAYGKSPQRWRLVTPGGRSRG